MITFIADHVKITSPSPINDEVTITFKSGQYVWDMIKDLPNLNGESIVVNVSKESEKASNDN